MYNTSVAFTSEFHQQLNNFLSEINISKKTGYCVLCGEEIKEFRDEISLREYNISGTCQECQDLLFKE